MAGGLLREDHRHRDAERRRPCEDGAEAGGRKPKQRNAKGLLVATRSRESGLEEILPQASRGNQTSPTDMLISDFRHPGP